MAAPQLPARWPSALLGRGSHGVQTRPEVFRQLLAASSRQQVPGESAGGAGLRSKPSFQPRLHVLTRGGDTTSLQGVGRGPSAVLATRSG